MNNIANFKLNEANSFEISMHEHIIVLEELIAINWKLSPFANQYYLG